MNLLALQSALLFTVDATVCTDDVCCNALDDQSAEKCEAQGCYYYLIAGGQNPLTCHAKPEDKYSCNIQTGTCEVDNVNGTKNYDDCSKSCKSEKTYSFCDTRPGEGKKAVGYCKTVHFQPGGVEGVDWWEGQTCPKECPSNPFPTYSYCDGSDCLSVNHQPAGTEGKDWWFGWDKCPTNACAKKVTYSYSYCDAGTCKVVTNADKKPDMPGYYDGNKCGTTDGKCPANSTYQVDARDGKCYTKQTWPTGAVNFGVSNGAGPKDKSTCEQFAAVDTQHFCQDGIGLAHAMTCDVPCKKCDFDAGSLNGFDSCPQTSECRQNVGFKAVATGCEPGFVVNNGICVMSSSSLELSTAMQGLRK